MVLISAQQRGRCLVTELDHVFLISLAAVSPRKKRDALAKRENRRIFPRHGVPVSVFDRERLMWSRLFDDDQAARAAAATWGCCDPDAAGSIATTSCPRAT